MIPPLIAQTPAPVGHHRHPGHQRCQGRQRGLPKPGPIQRIEVRAPARCSLQQAQQPQQGQQRQGENAHVGRVLPLGQVRGNDAEQVFVTKLSALLLPSGPIR